MSKPATTFLKLFVACLPMCTLLACSSKPATEGMAKTGPPPPMAVEGYVVIAAAFQTDYAAAGTLLPAEEVQLMPEIAGKVASIHFTEGAAVRKGQVLVTLNNEDTRAQLQKLEAQKALQLKTRQRQEELLKAGGISQQDFDATATQIASIDADVAYTRALLAKSVIKAPFDGRIGIRNISPGAVVTPATAIASLQQITSLKLDVSLPGQYSPELTPGKKIQFTVSGTLDTFAATILAAEPSADAATRTIKLRAVVANAGGRLSAGAFAHVIIPFLSNATALLVPSQSVIPTTHDKKVALVRGGKVELVTVKTGVRTKDQVEIVQGLAAGDTILTTGIMQVKQGMKVAVKIPG